MIGRGDLSLSFKSSPPSFSLFSSTVSIYCLLLTLRLSIRVVTLEHIRLAIELAVTHKSQGSPSLLDI